MDLRKGKRRRTEKKCADETMKPDIEKRFNRADDLSARPRIVRFQEKVLEVEVWDKESYDRSSTLPNLFSCDLCSRMFAAGLRGFETYCVCVTCDADFDVCMDCASICMESDKITVSGHERGLHTFSFFNPTDEDN
tara:strand:- start:116 stop:523 length:408 start_codon:yes stop_codon:yes gene_type:complete